MARASLPCRARMRARLSEMSSGGALVLGAAKSVGVSVLVFREKVSGRELLGIGLLAAGIVGVVTVA